MVGIGVLGSLGVGGSEGGGMEVRAVCGQEGSWREDHITGIHKRIQR